ncbi:phosphoenolpyruvate carboxykinase (ATP) [Chytriomyces confervae]|uniref:Phosphoenolpyruvate carboxykinase (ATP) n=1 Tax=Chytriomyces confervae TaxID=246404 RepID=A0A507D335_9FUNG|nr:phosphoenolpyruvate carboxykinase (ATP) [Chytriomyces confervae]
MSSGSVRGRLRKPEGKLKFFSLLGIRIKKGAWANSETENNFPANVCKPIIRNAATAVLYEEALAHEAGTALTASGALALNSGAKKGRSPNDKRIVDEPSSTGNIWWGPVNIKMSENSFMVNRERAVDYLNTRPRLYVFDGFAGWDPKYRIKVRVVCARAYHALFMKNMLIRPTAQELENFGEPDFTIFNSGEFPANRYTTGMTSTTSVALSFERREMNTRVIDYEDASLTENTRCAYPIEYIPNAKIPCVGSHPKNIILLTCDAFGVLPPVSKLTPAQVSYHFISGYTAKIAGTEEGVTEPQATFSSCFGAPFLVWHPTKYASMLAEKMKEHEASAWLINTGWNGGAYGTGKRISLKYSRAIIDAIHSGELDKVEFENYPVFNLSIPKTCTGVPSEVLNPSKSWMGTADSYTATTEKLAKLFIKNFAAYADKADHAVLQAGPSV